MTTKRAVVSSMFPDRMLQSFIDIYRSVALLGGVFVISSSVECDFLPLLFSFERVLRHCICCY